MSTTRSIFRDGPITIAIADGNALSCKLLEAELSKYQQFRVIDFAFSHEQLLTLFEQAKPAIVLIGLSLQNGPRSGLDAIYQLHTEHEATSHFILLVDRIEPEVVVAAFRNGARGIFCLSDSNLRLLRKCIDCVHEGQVWANTDVINHVLKAFTSTVSPRLLNANGDTLLSPREEAVAGLVAAGLSNRDVAKELGLSGNTVKNYLFRIFDKLGVSNRVELVLYVSAQGLCRGATDEATPRKIAASERIIAAAAKAMVIGNPS